MMQPSNKIFSNREKRKLTSSSLEFLKVTFFRTLLDTSIPLQRAPSIMTTCQLEFANLLAVKLQPLNSVSSTSRCSTAVCVKSDLMIEDSVMFSSLVLIAANESFSTETSDSESSRRRNVATSVSVSRVADRVGCSNFIMWSDLRVCC